MDLLSGFGAEDNLNIAAVRPIVILKPDITKSKVPPIPDQTDSW